MPTWILTQDILNIPLTYILCSTSALPAEYNTTASHWWQRLESPYNRRREVHIRFKSSFTYQGRFSDGEEIRRISQSEHTSQTKFFPIRKHSSKRPPARQLISCDIGIVQVRSSRSVLCSLCDMLKVLRKHENLIVASQPFNWCSANASNICWSVRGEYVLWAKRKAPKFSEKWSLRSCNIEVWKDDWVFISSLLNKFIGGAQERGRYLVNELSCFISVCGIHSRAEWSDFFLSEYCRGS